ncbi:MAG: hypothetical protein MRQ11_01475 [Candidatus Midichloria mitochondrii]|nr:hypothetical protein [Candidatus Midichloria mitochondrii]MDJ1313673.1 hypothetical protein [Candidatus Midichloria mitochondrii]MDJ1583362.1 hypothetical protein [Candidatus Midichloria mitochondrii]
MIDLKLNLEDCGIRTIERLTGKSITAKNLHGSKDGGGTLCARKVR